MRGPKLLHIHTKKGKGYKPAEQNPGEYHGIGSFEIATGNPDVVLSDSFYILSLLSSLVKNFFYSFLSPLFSDSFIILSPVLEFVNAFWANLSKTEYSPDPFNSVTLR